MAWMGIDVVVCLYLSSCPHSQFCRFLCHRHHAPPNGHPPHVGHFALCWGSFSPMLGVMFLYAGPHFRLTLDVIFPLCWVPLFHAGGHFPLMLGVIFPHAGSHVPLSWVSFSLMLGVIFSYSGGTTCYYHFYFAQL